MCKETLARISGCAAVRDDLLKLNKGLGEDKELLLAEKDELLKLNKGLGEDKELLLVEKKALVNTVMKLDDRLLELTEQLAPPEAPKDKGTISSGDIRSLYRQIFPDWLNRLHISDRTFEITTIAELRRFVEWSGVDKLKYEAEFLDCDDFAVALAGEFARYPGWSGFPVTFLWGDIYGGHAFCTAVAWKSLEDKTPTVYFIEPQNDLEIAPELVEEMNLWVLPMRRR
ncbi:MAG: hypothetical protein KAR06_02935 [Deltaproteobacteria bacterium]|nr:hypothetical protein [Deltaproteobacteria bacterium]